MINIYSRVQQLIEKFLHHLFIHSKFIFTIHKNETFLGYPVERLYCTWCYVGIRSIIVFSSIMYV